MPSLRRLWTTVVDNLKVRHPDRAVEVSLAARFSVMRGADSTVLRLIPWDRGVMTEDPRGLLEFTLNNLPDTSLLKDTRLYDFRFTCEVTGWPGTKLAEDIIVGTWLLYMEHEALELVTRLPDLVETLCRCGCGHTYPRDNRVIDPHTSGKNKENIRALSDAMALHYTSGMSKQACSEILRDARLRYLDEVEETYG